MIFLVTKQQELFESDLYKVIDEQDALEMMKDWTLLQVDSETAGRNCYLCDFLCVQFGNDKADARIVIDCTTVDIRLFKNTIESKRCLFQNAKFDLQFFYNYDIIPRKIYDTMIAEQTMYLGYPTGIKSYSLKSIAWDRLKIDIDKSVRGEIIWRGLSPEVILYAAGDVTYLEKIMYSQIAEAKRKDCLKALELECNAVPAVAYLEWCGIKLDETKWKAKMKKDREKLETRLAALNSFLVKDERLQEFVYIDRQGDLFTGFDLTPKCLINWDSSQQVIKVAKILGFDTTIQDKKTGEDKDSVLEKTLKMQKGINDTFLKLYFDYKESSKVCSTYGQGHLNIINPKTGRIHTNYKLIGASSGRMSCGSGEDEDIAKIKKLPPSQCKLPNLQQLPNDEETRACFVAEKGNCLIDCDFAAEEARLAGDIYQDQAIIDMFNRGLDSHSVYAKVFFKDQLSEVPVEEVKAKFPKLRQLAKGPEFALSFGGGARAIMQALACSEEEANAIIKNYEEGFKGTAEFAKRGSKFVRENGYVLINPITGHKMWWWDWKEWKERQKEFTPAFWEEYRQYHKGTGDSVALKVREHFKAASKYDRMVRNSPCQGTAAIILKEAATNLFNYVVDNNLFGTMKLCALVHDEMLWEAPINSGFEKTVEKFMFDAAAKYCKSLPIPASAEVDTCWRH